MPILIAHSEDDWDIPAKHSQSLFEAFLDPKLPSIVGIEGTKAQLEVLEARYKAREALVDKREIERVGNLEVYERDNGNRVEWLQTFWGGHNRVGLHEGVVDHMGQMFGFL